MAQPDRLEGAPDAAVGVDGVERRHRNLSVTLAHSRDGTHTLALSAKPGAVRCLRTIAWRASAHRASQQPMTMTPPCRHQM